MTDRLAKTMFCKIVIVILVLQFRTEKKKSFKPGSSRGRFRRPVPDGRIRSEMFQSFKRLRRFKKFKCFTNCRRLCLNFKRVFTIDLTVSEV